MEGLPLTIGTTDSNVFGGRLWVFVASSVGHQFPWCASLTASQLSLVMLLYGVASFRFGFGLCVDHGDPYRWFFGFIGAFLIGMPIDSLSPRHVAESSSL